MDNDKWHPKANTALLKFTGTSLLIREDQKVLWKPSTEGIINKGKFVCWLDGEF